MCREFFEDSERSTVTANQEGFYNTIKNHFIPQMKTKRRIVFQPDGLTPLNSKCDKTASPKGNRQ